MIPLKPVRCSPCEQLVLGEDPYLQRHQVTEIPPVKPVVAEYQLHSLVCPGYGEATRAELRAGIPTGGFGPRVQAITGLCTGAYHLSKRTIQTVMADLFGVVMGLGTVAHLEQGMVQVLVDPVAEARASVQAQPTAHLDETGWCEGSPRAWLWTAVMAWVTVFVVRLPRGAKVAQEFLGARFRRWLVTDRWSAYTWYPSWRWQLCWTHLLRDIKAMLERGGRPYGMGRRGEGHQPRRMPAAGLSARDDLLRGEDG